jgi:N-acylneuraminate cytidylyltransferase
MDNLVDVLALIPARGGSKSIPRKNIRSFAGHPLIAYSIAAGLAAETVTRLVVSTDDDEIAAIARRYGAETPFLRPAEFSQDGTPDLPVFQHALRWLAEHDGYQPEIVVQLRPTSPFRRVRHIDEAIYSLMDHPEADSIRAVCIPFQNPFKMWRIGPDGFMHPLGAELSALREPYNQPRQALPDIYWQTGYVDAAWADTILTRDSMTGERILPLVIDPSEWIDIDSPDDWRRAERLLETGEVTLEELGYSIENRE